MLDKKHADELAKMQGSVQEKIKDAIVEYLTSDEQYALLTQRYDGGWKSFRFLLKARHLEIDLSAIEDD